MRAQRELVVDANVLLNVALERPGHEQGLEAVAKADELFAPDLQLCEIAHVLTKAVRRGEMSVDLAVERRETISRIPIAHTSAQRLDLSAFQLSLITGHSAYDCFYLALAIERRCPLLTCDAGLAAAAERVGFGDYVELVGA